MILLLLLLILLLFYYYTCICILGFIMKIPIFDQVEDEDALFDDTMFWNVAEEMPGGEEEEETGKR